MNTQHPALDWFNPTILSPGFFNGWINAASEEDEPFLSVQLRRHLFRIIRLSGGDMNDRHGFIRSMALALGVRESSFGYGRETVPDLHDLFKAGAERRVAFIIEQADRLIEADVQRFLTLTSGVERAGESLKAETPRTQLQMFLLGPGPSFPGIEAAAKRRAESENAIKVTRQDVTVGPWNSAVDFDLGPRHHLLLSHADWYYCSRGRRAGGTGESQWHCLEEEDRLLFIHADDGAPSFEGVFARLPHGMQLVGIRYEADDARRRVSLVAEDPFTAFRQLCQRLGLC